MIRFFLLCCLIFIYPSLHSQELFPNKCIGNWKGMMHIYHEGKLKDSVEIRLLVARLSDSSWTWKTDYISDKFPMTKNYTFRLINKDKNQFVTDEGGGILLNENVFGNKAYSVFETHDVLLTSTYEIRGDELLFEVTSSKKNKIIDEVVNHPISNIQKVTFKKVENN